MKILFNKAAILSTALSNQFILITFNITLFVVIAKTFSINVLASWAIFQSVTSIIEMIRLGFIQNAMMNQIKSNPSNKLNIIKSNFFIYTILTIIAYVMVILIFEIITELNSNLYNFSYIYYYGISLIGIGLMQFVNIINQANENHAGITKINLIWVITSLVVISILYLSNKICPENILLTTGITSTVIVLFHVRKHLKSFQESKIEKESCNSTFQFGKYVFGTNLLSMLINKSDIFILSIFSQPSGIAAYHIAIRIANYLEIPLNAATQVFYPKIHNAFKKNLRIDKVITESVIIQWIYIIPAAIVLFLLSGKIIEILSGSNYVTESSFLLRIVIFASFIKPIGRTMGIALDIKNRPDLNLRILILSGIIFTTLQLSLGSFYHSMGIAIANVLATWISILFAQFFISQKINFSIINPIYQLVTKKIKSKTI